MRSAGVPAELVAPMMGHADTRMVARVYSRLSVTDLGRQVSAFFPQNDCSNTEADPADSGFLSLGSG